MGGREFGADTKNGIAREQVEPTLAYIAKLAGIPREDLIALGSAGKKARSGDIDIAIDSRKYGADEYAEIVARLQKAIGAEHSLYRAGFHTHAFAVPIAGNPRNGRVQIDLKHNDADFLQFSHYSAEGERSQFKGAVRSRLLASLAASIYKDGQDVRHVEGGKTVVDVRWGLDVNAGLKRIYRMCKTRQDGKGRKKDLENVTPAEIRAEFPDLEFNARQQTIVNPARIATRLFGAGVKPKDFETPEDLIKLIQKKHPELVKQGFLERVGRQLSEMGLAVPPELAPAGKTAKRKPAKTEPAKAAKEEIDLSTERLPKFEPEWREFRQTKGGRTKVWAISVEPDGESFRFKEGSLGGKLHEYNPVRPGERGRPGSANYTSAADACRREVERRIQLRLSSGYAEVVEGELAKPVKSGLDFGQPFPRNIKTPKPEQFIDDGELKRLYDAGLTRITRKYDGMGVTVVNHTYGWEVYSLQGNRLTDFFPNQVEALQKQKNLGPGTILKGEAIFFKEGDSLREDFSLMPRLSPSRDWKTVRAEIDSGEVPEPAFVFYDALYHNGKELSDATYDQRAKLWNKLPVARAGNGLLLSAEYYDVTPENWRDKRKELGFEGFVVVDGSSTLGKKVVSFGSAPPRPKGCYKLKPNMEEDIVVYAVREVDGVYESVFAKQRYPDLYPGSNIPHPKAGEWFACGRISIAGKKDVIEKIEELVQAGVIQAVSNNKDGEKINVDNSRGVVTVVEFFDRHESNKFRHPKFTKPTRFRDEGADFKAPEECTAHYLGESTPPAKEEKTTSKPMRGSRRSRGDDDGASAHA